MQWGEWWEIKFSRFAYRYYCSPDYQNKGYGKIVVTELLKLAQENMQDGDLMCIEAAPTNGNIPFYIKCGMKHKPEEQEGVYIWLKSRKESI